MRPITAACPAVNVHLWDLGPNVLIGCGDGLVADWPDQAREDRRAGIAALRSVHAAALLHRLERALQVVAAGSH